MKLLTKEIEKKIPALYSTEDVKVEEKKVNVKFFTPDSNWTWWAWEGQRIGDDYEFFGIVEGHVIEIGYFRLSDLEKVRGPFGLKVERDKWFDGKLPENIINYLTN